MFFGLVLVKIFQNDVQKIKTSATKWEMTFLCFLKPKAQGEQLCDAKESEISYYFSCFQIMSFLFCLFFTFCSLSLLLHSFFVSFGHSNAWLCSVSWLIVSVQSLIPLHSLCLCYLLFSISCSHSGWLVSTCVMFHWSPLLSIYPSLGESVSSGSCFGFGFILLFIIFSCVRFWFLDFWTLVSVFISPPLPH